MSQQIICPVCGGNKAHQTSPQEYECEYCGATIKMKMPLMEQTVTTSRCRFCGGEIDSTARKCRHCGEWVQPISHPFTNPHAIAPKSTKSKTTAALLAILLGGWGIHEFYLGHTGLGILFLILWFCFSWTIFIPLVLCVISIIQGINYLCMSQEQFEAKYH